MTGSRRTLDHTLAQLAERICVAAGTDLGAVLNDLTATAGDPRTPAAIRSGWHVADTTLPAPDGTVTA
ncbi:hypothetical protein ACFC3F_05580 [Microbacterium sp. NPDC055910]|uniref:hypothetical protein n=1 Tax=Microbacterium sp. NPDC055910 TaxID=3345659 RepID=UPI0035D71BD0